MLNSESMGWPIRAGWMLLIVSQFLPVWFSSYALAVLILLVLVGWKSNNWRELRHNGWFRGLLFYFCWQLLSLLWTQNWADAGSNLGTQLLLVLLPGLLLIRKPDQADLRWLFKAQLLSSLAAVAGAFVFAAWRVYHSPVIDETIYYAYFFYTGLSEPIMHPGYFSLQLIVSLGILVKFWMDKHWRVNTGSITAGICLLACLVMLNGRMTMLAALLTLGLAVVYQAITLKRWKPVAVLLGIVLLFVLSFRFLPSQVQLRLLEVTESLDYDIKTYQAADYNGITVRLAQWECAAEVIQDNLWFGTGAGDGKDALREVYTQKGFQTGLVGQYNSHNQFVEAALYGGLIQSFLLLGIFVYGIRRGFKTKNLLFVAFLAFIFLCLQTETILFWHRGVLFFGIFSSLLYLNLPDKVSAPNR